MILLFLSKPVYIDITAFFLHVIYYPYFQTPTFQKNPISGFWALLLVKNSTWNIGGWGGAGSDEVDRPWSDPLRPKFRFWDVLGGYRGEFHPFQGIIALWGDYLRPRGWLSSSPSSLLRTRGRSMRIDIPLEDLYGHQEGLNTPRGDRRGRNGCLDARKWQKRPLFDQNWCRWPRFWSFSAVFCCFLWFSAYIFMFFSTSRWHFFVFWDFWALKWPYFQRPWRRWRRPCSKTSKRSPFPAQFNIHKYVFWYLFM